MRLNTFIESLPTSSLSSLSPYVRFPALIMSLDVYVVKPLNTTMVTTRVKTHNLLQVVNRREQCCSGTGVNSVVLHPINIVINSVVQVCSNSTVQGS